MIPKYYDGRFYTTWKIPAPTNLIFRQEKPNGPVSFTRDGYTWKLLDSPRMLDAAHSCEGIDKTWLSRAVSGFKMQYVQWLIMNAVSVP
jgi:hypothetical protein